MNGMHKVASMVSNRRMAPPMIVIGLSASCNPDITEAQQSNGSLPRYMVLTRNIMSAAKGRDVVVGRGRGTSVAMSKKMIGSKHKMTSMADPQGPPPTSSATHPHSLQAVREVHSSGHVKSAPGTQLYNASSDILFESFECTRYSFTLLMSVSFKIGYCCRCQWGKGCESAAADGEATSESEHRGGEKDSHTCARMVLRFVNIPNKECPLSHVLHTCNSRYVVHICHQRRFSIYSGLYIFLYIIFYSNLNTT